MLIGIITSIAVNNMFSDQFTSDLVWLTGGEAFDMCIGEFGVRAPYSSCVSETRDTHYCLPAFDVHHNTDLFIVVSFVEVDEKNVRPNLEGSELCFASQTNTFCTLCDAPNNDICVEKLMFNVCAIFECKLKSLTI